MSKSHLFLKNEFGTCPEFKRTRGRNNEEETSGEVKNYHQQREKLLRCRAEFERAMENRHNLRSQEINVDHFDMLSINFLKIADSALIKEYCEVYGLSELNYSNMNQTVLFAIADVNRFNNVFITQINSFSAEDNDESTEYKPLTLIADFSY
ncbi:hypothetical protein [Prevotella sp. HJM029]|nr:hypothetical protein [Prevotella sp. HJM029]